VELADHDVTMQSIILMNPALESPENSSRTLSSSGLQPLAVVDIFACKY
jgi:hypothetical protein